MMKKISNELLNEDYYYLKLKNGLTVYLIHRPKFNRCYGLYMTLFGSCDQEFVPVNETKFVKVPAGVAHFLEHKTFELENDGDATELFAEFGGEVNAYTTYDKTVYMFTGTSNILEQIKILLNFVDHPHFTVSNIEKERGIIEQEVMMYSDKPGTVLYNSLLSNMYEKNYVKDDIGGSIESIKEIDIDTLYKCYNTFYNPSNMTFVLVGNFELDKVVELLEERSSNCEKELNKIKRRYYLESNSVIRKDTESTFDIAIPKVGCGVKFSVINENKKTIYKNMLCLDLLLDICFDESSDFYHEMLEQNIIDNSFSYDSYYESTYAHVIFSVNTTKIDEFKSKLHDKLLRISTLNIDEKTFSRYKRVELANTIARFNSIEYIANLIIDLDSLGLELFDSIDIKNDLTIDDLNCFKKQFCEEAITFHTLKPLK